MSRKDLLPYPDTFRSHYTDPSSVRCGPVAFCQMLSFRTGVLYDYEQVYQLAKSPDGDWTSPKSCLEAMASLNLIPADSWEWFGDPDDERPVLATAKACINARRAFVVLSKWPGTDGHMWCVRGMRRKKFYSPFSGGGPDVKCSFAEFERQMGDWDLAVCAVLN